MYLYVYPCPAFQIGGTSLQRYHNYSRGADIDICIQHIRMHLLHSSEFVVDTKPTSNIGSTTTYCASTVVIACACRPCP